MDKFKPINSKEDRARFNDLMLLNNKDSKSDDFLHRYFWEKIKNTFDSEEMIEKYVDNEDNIIILEDEIGFILIGFLGIDRKFDRTNKSISNSVVKTLLEFNSDIRNLMIDKEIISCRIIYFTTYKLSEFQSDNFSFLPTDCTYFYLAKFDENNELKLVFKNDVELVDIINRQLGDNFFLDYAMKKSKKNDQNQEWHCEICGSNNFSGCKYFDTSECPKFT